jgi:hypothetical protein
MTAEQKIAAMMSKASKARTSQSRSKGGRKAWQTRIKNLRARLERLESKNFSKPKTESIEVWKSRTLT